MAIARKKASAYFFDEILALNEVKVALAKRYNK
jgi:hypothetical protein